MLNQSSVARHLDYGVVHYSFHSFRRMYATCLGQVGATKEQIQSMVRWFSDEAVEIYNGMSESQQIKHVEAAYNAAPKNVTPVLLTQMNVPRRIAAIEIRLRPDLPHCWLFPAHS